MQGYSLSYPCAANQNMTDDQQPKDQQSSGKSDVRRVSRKDRKPKLDTGHLIFPPDAALPEAKADEKSAAEAPDAPGPAEKRPAAVEERYPPVNPTAPLKPPKTARKRRQSRNPLWYNVGTVLFVLASVVVLAYYVMIALNPYSSLNPLPPFTPMPVIVTTTPLPPTMTPTAPPTEAPTTEPTGTFTPLPAALLPTRATFTPAPFPFTISSEGVTYKRNLTNEGCEWVSIAGSVSGLQGEILNGYGVRVQGEGVDQTVYTGGADSLFFAPGEFEVLLGNAPVVAPFTVSLFSPEGEVISDGYMVVTSDQCSQNVALINFVQNRPLE